MRVLEICPYEPPASGWVTRIKLLRKVIQERGGRCEILDIGPNRRLERPDCIPVKDGWDYFRKVLRFSRGRFTVHCHINGEYFRGLLLALAACLCARAFRNRCLVTFHGGVNQPFLAGWRGKAVSLIFRIIFRLAHHVICNSETEKMRLSAFQRRSKIVPIPAFSRQYLEYVDVKLDQALDRFLREHSPSVSTYLCFREGFFTEVLVAGVLRTLEAWPKLGLVVVGTGDGSAEFIEQIAARGLEANVYMAGNLNHDAFMTLLSRSDIFLRTPHSDGVSASVLEALFLGIPVVASENGSRPAGVVTYKATDCEDLSRKLVWTLNNPNRMSRSVESPPIEDTTRTEIDLIMGCAS